MYLSREITFKSENSRTERSFYLHENVVLAGHWLLFQALHIDISFSVLPDLQTSLGTGLAGISQQINNRLVVDLNERSLQL